MPRYDRALLLYGPKRNEVLRLAEVEQYGHDNFGDADYVRVYGMRPGDWYQRGIRLLGRTVVECTRDTLGDLIGRDIASIVVQLPPTMKFAVIDPFAGSCNTLYWILRHVPASEGIAFELDQQVFNLSKRNIAKLNCNIELVHGDYKSLLEGRRFPPEWGIIVFVAPPWGTALDEVRGLDLQRTTPPVTGIVGHILRQHAQHNLLFAIQVYEKISGDSLFALQQLLDWTELRVYNINEEGRNHGILLGTKGIGAVN